MAPRALNVSVRPRRLAGVVARPLNFTVRRPMLRASAIVLTLALSLTAVAGDDASGPTPFRVDLSSPHETYSLTDADRAWAQDLAARLRYHGRIVYFLRTSLVLSVGGADRPGNVYRRSDRAEQFYVVSGDVMLVTGERYPFNPGVGGLSMHAPKSKHFIACLNCQDVGVPVLSSSPVTLGVVEWKGHSDRSRL